MATDPGDLVLDATCGSGTTATVAEQWGRRWITIDTSRVALALARTRLMSARYPWYLLADSEEGRAKETELTLRPPSDAPVYHDIHQGFIYERVPHIMLSDIANNARIDDIWERWQVELEPLREALNHRRNRFYADEREGYNREETQIAPAPADPDLPPFEEWTMPREPGTPWPDEALKPFAAAQKDTTGRATREKHLAKLNHLLGRTYTLETLPDAPVDPWDDKEAIALHTQWWEARIARQKEIDEVIAKTAETEYLYDKPYEDPSRVRVAGPFTVESLSPHRVLPASEDDSLGEDLEAAKGKRQRSEEGANNDFAAIVIEYLKLSALKHADYKGTFGKVPSRYSLRGGDRENIGTLFEASGLRSVAVPQPGDCVLVQAGVAQFHLMIVTDGGHVHAHAGLGRVVEMPGPSPWPVEGYWSVRA